MAPVSKSGGVARAERDDGVAGVELRPSDPLGSTPCGPVEVCLGLDWLEIRRRRRIAAGIDLPVAA